mmetsp:Transcript_6827/g.21526  ORF Transcript_6827/g.21526 Transcript_6827/m.21526 type:complete len:166 (-) Transcript_6827:30-527(-)
MRSSIIALVALLSPLHALAPQHTSRRALLRSVAVGAPVLISPQLALASPKADAETVLQALEPLSGYVDEARWDAVRTVLKTSPVAELWNLGQGKNWIRKAALDAGDPELIELSEDLSSALQLTDQYVYDNNFIYFQPGNGKLKTKEPKDQIKIAQTKLKTIISSL